MNKQHRFRPTVDARLEERLAMSGVVAAAEVAITPSPSQIHRTNRLIQSAYNRYLSELVDASNDGVESIQTGTRSPELALLGMQNFAVRKEAFLERQLRASVQGLPYARRVLLPQLNQIARSALQALQATTNITDASAQATREAVQPYAILSKHVIATGGRS